MLVHKLVNYVTGDLFLTNNCILVHTLHGHCTIQHVILLVWMRKIIFCSFMEMRWTYCEWRGIIMAFCVAFGCNNRGGNPGLSWHRSVITDFVDKHMLRIMGTPDTNDVTQMVWNAKISALHWFAVTATYKLPFCDILHLILIFYTLNDTYNYGLS